MYKGGVFMEKLSWCQRVQIEMLKRKMTTVELAKIVGYSRPYVANIVNGHVFSETANKKISDVLNVEYEDWR